MVYKIITRPVSYRLMGFWVIKGHTFMSIDRRLLRCPMGFQQRRLGRSHHLGEGLGVSLFHAFNALEGRHERLTGLGSDALDRKSTRLNSSHANISYAVFCLKKKKNRQHYSCTSN